MSESREAWKRIGLWLRARRAAIDPEYHQRARWIRDVERAGLGGRVIVDLELGERGNFSDRTLALAEEAYRLQPGSLRRAAEEGGEPVPREDGEEGGPSQEDAGGGQEGPSPPMAPGERLSWRRLDEERVEYELHRPDGSGAMMVVAAGTPREDVVAWLRADADIALRVLPPDPE